jgi:hypothetical protein
MASFRRVLCRLRARQSCSEASISKLSMAGREPVTTILAASSGL